MRAVFNKNKMIFTSDTSTLKLSSDLRDLKLSLKVTSEGNYTLELPSPNDTTKLLIIEMQEGTVDSFHLEIDNTHTSYDSLIFKNPKSTCRLEARGDKWCFRGGVHIDLN
jgi:hypothetical protein